MPPFTTPSTALIWLVDLALLAWLLLNLAWPPGAAIMPPPTFTL